MNSRTGRISPVGLTCVGCYLLPQLVFIARALFFPTTQGGEWFWAFILTFPWFKFTTALFETTAVQLASGILLSSATYYLAGHLLDRVYFGKHTDKSSTRDFERTV